MSAGRMGGTYVRGTGKRARERSHIRFKDVFKRDLRAMGLNVDWWEDVANDRSHGRLLVLGQVEKCILAFG